jgi:hypothetical protein
MRITESQLRSIIKNELNQILFERIKLDPGDPKNLYGIPAWAITKAFENEKNESDTVGNTLSNLPWYLAAAIHGEENATKHHNIYSDLLHKEGVYETLRNFYSSNKQKNKLQKFSDEAGNKRNDRFAKRHGF